MWAQVGDDSECISLDLRPSDAVNIAVRCKVLRLRCILCSFPMLSLENAFRHLFYSKKSVATYVFEALLEWGMMIRFFN